MVSLNFKFPHVAQFHIYNVEPQVFDLMLIGCNWFEVFNFNITSSQNSSSPSISYYLIHIHSKVLKLYFCSWLQMPICWQRIFAEWNKLTHDVSTYEVSIYTFRFENIYFNRLFITPSIDIEIKISFSFENTT